MPFPYDSATLDAISRLANYYNGGIYSSTSNPGGMGEGGHRVNFIPALDDLAIVVDSAADAANAAGSSATSASNSATTASNAATALEGTSSSNVTVGLGAKSFTTQANKSFTPGSYIYIVLEESPLTHYMEGLITSYTTGTGALVVSVVASKGIGTFDNWLLYGRAGPPGVQGLTGATGPAGPSPAPRWTFASGITDVDPGTGRFAFNNATLASVVWIYVDDVDALGATQTAFLDSLDNSTNSAVLGTLFIQAVNSSSIYAMFNVIGNVVVGTGYRKIPVAYVSSLGAFNTTVTACLVFTRAGDKGADGAGAGNMISVSSGVTTDDLLLWNNTSGTSVKTAGFGIGTSGNKVPKLNTVNEWSGKQTFAAGCSADQAFQLSGGLTPPQLTASVNDYAPFNGDISTVWRLSSNAAWSITGIAGGTDGRLLVTQNVGGFPISFPNNSSSSSVNNRFLTSTGATVTINQNQAITWIYDANSGWWRSLTSFGVSAAAAFGTDNAVLRADGTGNAIQASNATIDDTGNLTSAGFVLSNSGLIQSTKTSGFPTFTSFRSGLHGATTIGGVLFQGQENPLALVSYGQILAVCLDDTAGSKDSQLLFYVQSNNNFQAYLRLVGTVPITAYFDASIYTTVGSIINQGTGVVPTYTSYRLDTHGAGAVVSQFDINGKNAAGTTVPFAQMQVICDDPTVSAEDTRWLMKAKVAGSMVDWGVVPRRMLLANHTVYVRNDATGDTNRNGSADTTASAFKTWQAAINYVDDNIFTNGFDVTFKMGGTTNTFSQANNVIECTSRLVGGGLRIFEGKPIGVGATSDCTITTTAAQARVISFTNAGTIIFKGQWRITATGADSFGLINNGFSEINNRGHLHFQGNFFECHIQQHQEGAYFSNNTADLPDEPCLIWFDGNANDNYIRNDSGTFHDNGTIQLKGNGRTFDAFYRGDFFSQGYLSANLNSEGSTGHVGNKIILNHRASLILYGNLNPINQVPGNTKGFVQAGSVLIDKHWDRAYNIVHGTATIAQGNDNAVVTFNPNYSEQPDTNYMVTFDSSVIGRIYSMNTRLTTGFQIKGNAVAGAGGETVRWRLEWLPP